MAKREKGVGPYAGNNVTLRRDTSVDNSGNPIVRPRQITNVDEGANGSAGTAAIPAPEFSRP